MSLYSRSAKQRDFNANVIRQPDASDKIRAQGLQQLKYMQQELDAKNKQAKQLQDVFNQNIELEQKLRDQAFRDRREYGQILAKHKWKQYETSINNAKQKQHQAQKDLKAILSLTQSGAQIYGEWDKKNKQSIDNFAAEIYRDYGVNQEKFDAIRNLQSSVLKNDTELNSALVKLQLEGVPLDVIARIRRGGGYMNLAVGKLAARRRAQQLGQYLAQESNTELKLPGSDTPIQLSTARGPNLEIALQELISRYFRDENGEQLFSSKMMELGGVNQLVDQHKATWRRRDTERSAKEEFKDQHKSTVTLIKDFTGYNADLGRDRGAEGYPLLVEHLAGGPNASASAFRIAKRKVQAAAVQGLKNGTLKWETLKGLETLPVSHKSSKKKQPWSHLNPGEFQELEKAALAFDTHEQNAVILKEQGLREEGREYYENMLRLNEEYEGEIPTEILQKMLGYGTKRGHHFEKGVQYLQKIQAYGNTVINDKVGVAALLSKSERGEIITDEDINKWNLSKSVQKQIRARIAKYNTWLPEEGKDGTRERLNYRIETELNRIVDKKTSWNESVTWNDTRIHALQEASRYYRSARESGKSHEQSYVYARDMITEDIKTGGKDGYYIKTSKNGRHEFTGALAQKQDVIEINRAQLGEELTSNPNFIYSKKYIDTSDLKRISGKANKGLYPEMHGIAMVIQKETNGRVSAVDVMQAQLQQVINEEIQASGAASTQLLPDDYVEKYKKASTYISPFAQSLLESYNLVDINKAAMAKREDGSRTAPVYTQPIIQNAQPILEDIKGRPPTAKEKFYLKHASAAINNTTGIWSSDFNMHDTALLNLKAFDVLYQSGRYKQLKKEAAQSNSSYQRMMK